MINTSIYNELITVCKDVPILVYRGKYKKQAKLNVIQQVLNTYFRLKFRELGWDEEPFATLDTSEDSLRSDFKKKFYTLDGEEFGIQIEVEFGNIAKIISNFNYHILMV